MTTAPAKTRQHTEPAQPSACVTKVPPSPRPAKCCRSCNARSAFENKATCKLSPLKTQQLPTERHTKSEKTFQISPRIPTSQKRPSNPIPVENHQPQPMTKVPPPASPLKVVDLVNLSPHLKTKPLTNRHPEKPNNSPQKSAQKTKREAEASLLNPSPNQAALASTLTLSAIEVSFASAAFSSFSVASRSCTISFSPSRFANVRADP